MTLSENNERGILAVQSNKRRRKKSIVWDHFTVEDVGAGCTRACCKQCNQTFAYSTGTKLSGTSHLKRHIAFGTCLANRRKEKNQLKCSGSRTNETGRVTDPPRRRSNESSGSVSFQFNQEICRRELAKMIIIHEYPLHMVEHPAFVSFVKKLQPQFNLVNFDAVRQECIAIYRKEKQELIELFRGIPGRVCLSVDLWTSSETLGYIFVTGHFINSQWKAHNRILNVVMVPFPHRKDVLSHAIGTCVGEWGLENKLLSLTLNNSIFRSDTRSLKGYFFVNNSLILNSQLLLEHCFGEVLSSIAQDAIGGMQETVNKVRKNIKYVKTSCSHEQKFLELKQKLQVPSTKCLSLDDHVQWNTTYLMLVAVMELKEVFSCLDTVDPNYILALSMDDWKQIGTLCTYLKLLYDSAITLSTSRYPTADMFFHEAWKIQFALICAAESSNPSVLNLTNPLRQKFDMYWNDCSVILAIAVVLDPQVKMNIVEYGFSKIYKDEASTYVKSVDQTLHELFSDYVMQFLPLTYTEPQSIVDVKLEEEIIDVKTEEHIIDVKTEEHILDVKTEELFDISSGVNLPADDFFDSDAFMFELSSSFNTKSELDQYLEEPRVPFVEDFDILSWWDLNSFKYPSLSKMAHDILSIPVSAVTPENFFSTGAKKLNHYWSSLQPETVQALLCAKDWLRYDSIDSRNTPMRNGFSGL